MNTLNASLDKIINDQIETGSYKTKEEVTQELLQILIGRDIDRNISNGIAQIENGQGIEVTPTYRDALRARLINRLSLSDF